jgi:hypothetical protein
VWVPPGSREKYIWIDRKIVGGGGGIEEMLGSSTRDPVHRSEVCLCGGAPKVRGTNH